MKRLALAYLEVAGFLLEQTLSAVWDAEAIVERWLP